MKKILLLAFIAIITVGCNTRTQDKIEEAKRLNGFNIVVIDSCEYLYGKDASGYAGFGFMAHKGNCKYCIERNSKNKK